MSGIPFRRGNRQVAWINSHCKIRTAAFFIGGIDSRIQTLRKRFFVTFDERIPGVPRLFEGVRISFGIQNAESKQIKFGAAVHRSFD